MASPRLLAIGTLCAVSAIVSPATAQSIEGGMPRAGEPSWADYTAPERRRARQLRRDGLVRLLDATLPNPPRPRDVLLDQALIRFTGARRAMPEDPDLLYFTALALAWWHADADGDGVEERRTDEAIDAFEELRRLDAEYHPDRVAFELAILHTRSHEPARSVDEYLRAIVAGSPAATPVHYLLTDREDSLASLFTPVPLAPVHINLAENAMLLGDLGTAIDHYRRGLDASSDRPLDRVLALWGLALALDRNGEHRDAIAVAQRAIAADPARDSRGNPIDDPRAGIDHAAHGPMAILHGVDVFFDPPFEVHAYDGVGWEALAEDATRPEDRERLLGLALRAWRTFLTAGGNRERFSEHATRAAERLEAQLAP